MNTVPTGFWALPPSGPAIPVMLTPTSTWACFRAPRAICPATGSLTAPCAARSWAETPSSCCFASFE